MSYAMADTSLMTTEMIGGESPAEREGATIRRLVERAKAGDSAAFDTIIIAYQKRVFSTAWRMLGNREDARDAGQEVFLRVFRHINTFKDDRDFSAWLYRIVINVCYDLSRKRSRMSFEVSAFEMERELLEGVASSENPEAAAIRAQEQAMIIRALKTLTERERAAIVLRDLEGLTTEDVAKVMGTSQVTIRSQICSARSKIRLFCDRLIKDKEVRR